MSYLVNKGPDTNSANLSAYDFDFHEPAYSPQRSKRGESFLDGIRRALPFGQRLLFRHRVITLVIIG